MVSLIKVLAALAWLTVPLLFVGGIAAVWLAILGKWSVVAWGVALLLASKLTFTLAFAPALLIWRGRDNGTLAKGKISFWICTMAGNFLNTTAVAIWCLGVFYLFVESSNSYSSIPTLLWAYSVATGPISHIAFVEMKAAPLSAIGSLITARFAELGFALAISASYLFDLRFAEIGVLLSTVMLLGICFTFLVSHWIESEESL